jgi:RNA polymerase sigma-70 factor (ECF subfamily)
VPVQTSATGLLSGEAVLDRLAEATDKKLVKWMRDGDTAAFEELFRRYETRLIAYAARYIGSLDLAKDVCQEVFLKLISKPPRVLICDSVGPWLFRVTRNLAIDKRRRRKFEIQEEDNELPEARAEGTPLSSLADKDDLDMIREMVDELPKDIREVVELRIDGRVPFKDIAVILDIPQGTALWRMHRAVQLLRQRWKTYEAEV